MPLVVRILCLVLVATAPAASGAARDSWAAPAAGDCRAAVRGDAGGGDVRVDFPFREGERIGADRVTALEPYLPEALWAHRDRFFHDGMSIEIGPCHRDYAPPPFFRSATERGGAELTESGGVEGWTAGLPFPPVTIDPDDAQAGLRWAWNAALRYQAAGHRGAFRLTELAGEPEKASRYAGEIFQVATTHRADLADADHAVDFARDYLFIAGGRFDEPFALRRYAWLQFRPVDSLHAADRLDEVRAYVPDLRRERRIPTAHLDGLYLPSLAAGTVQASALAAPVGGVAAGSGGGGAGGSGGGGGGASGGGAGGGGGGSPGTLPANVGTTTDRPLGGFESLAMRPQGRTWRVAGVRDVLAPINVVQPMYPAVEERDFGPHGLSIADRWELRRALVLDARGGDDAGSREERWYFDLQTLAPLYRVARTEAGEPVGVTVFAGRWSEDRPDYPGWPDDPERPVRVLDSVAAAHLDPIGRAGWRRESWNAVATPPPDDELRRMTSVTNLEQGR